LTLIEVLISVVLLAGGVVLVMQSFATASEAMARADDRSAAYLFAMSKLADLELAHQEGRDLTARSSGSFRVGRRPFSWRVELAPSAERVGGKLVTLSVTWPRGRSTDEAEYTMLLTPPPPPMKADKT